MYKKDFDTLIHSDAALQTKSFMLWGESRYYIDQYIQTITQKLEATEIVSYYYEDFDFQKIKTSLSQGSLFGDRSIYIYKAQKHINRSQLQAILDICSKSENSFFIYAIYSPLKNALAPLFTKKHSAVAVRFFEPNIPQALTELSSGAQRLGVDTDRHALEHLYFLHNMDLSLSMNELNKLGLVDGVVSSKDIDNLVYTTSSMKLENLFYDLVDNKDITTHLQQNLEAGDDSLKILRQAQYFFHNLFLFRSYIALHGVVDSKSILGYKLPRFIEEKKARYAQKLKILQYSYIFKRLNRLELELKGADSVSKDAILIASLYNIKTSLGAQR